MIITAKANIILHILDKFTDPHINNQELARKVNDTFHLARNNGTGSLGELDLLTSGSSQYQARHKADYVFANVPFYVNGVTQIDDSLKDLGMESFYRSCGIGVESRFLKYILSQIQNGNPGIGFVIVTDGILYRHKDKIRDVINERADMLGIISLPIGCFQNNNWKTSILIFRKKTGVPEYSPVFLYDIENIGISLDAYRAPIEENDIPGLKRAWQQRQASSIDNPKCKLIPREEFLHTKRWSDLFSWCRTSGNESNISYSEFVEYAEDVNDEISKILIQSDSNLGEIFSMDRYIEIELGNLYLFRWDDALGKDRQRLKKVMRNYFAIEWIEEAEISMSGNNKILYITKGEHAAEIILDKRRKKATLKISDAQIINLRIVREDSMLKLFCDSVYLETRMPKYKTTIRHAKLNLGRFPLYSSHVEGPATYMEDPNNPPILIKNETEGKDERLISWNIKGDPCKDIRMHDEPFYATENRGLIKVISDEIDFFYVLYYLREHLIELGNFKRSDEAHAGKIKRLKIKIPIDEKGNIDVKKQKEIVENYEKITELKKAIIEKISELKGLVDDIDIFK